MRRALSLLFVALAWLAIASCVGTTGGALVTFPAAAAGPRDAVAGSPLVFEGDRGWHVSLTKATMHVGAVYVDQSAPVSGAGDTACILPGTYVAQVTSGRDVDLLSPTPQRFPVDGDGTTGPGLVGQVWLTGGDVNAIDDRTPVLEIAGTATNGSDVRPFTGRVTIGANRESAGELAGASPPCKQRIASVPTRILVQSSGGLLLRIDPRQLFADVDFAALAPPPAGSNVYTFADDSSDAASANLYSNLHSGGSLYSFTWAAGLESFPIPSGDGGAPASGCSANPPASDGFTLASFCAPKDPGPAGVLFDVSGEALAITGYDFPPVNANTSAFVDGWAVKFTRLLVTVADVTLSSNPDAVPTDESQTGGVVARVAGPWAVDLSRADPSYLAGKGGPGEEAVPIAALSSQSDGASFATDGTRYAFGFDVVRATKSAANVNLDAASVADYEAMVKSGCTVLYVGTATFRGDKTNPACYPPAYASWPDVVDFRLCFQSPTTFVNCQNPDNGSARALPNEESERGIAFKSDESILAQLTIHTDHPFWDSVLHDSPAHFDQFAARALGQSDAGATAPMVTLEMTRGVDYDEYTDARGAVLDWRYCMDPPTDVHPKLTGVMKFDAQGVPHARGGDAATGLRDYADFATYDQSTQGHLNSDGLCFVKRNYPSPP